MLPKRTAIHESHDESWVRIPHATEPPFVQLSILHPEPINGYWECEYRDCSDMGNAHAPAVFNQKLNTSRAPTPKSSNADVTVHLSSVLHRENERWCKTDCEEVKKMLNKCWGSLLLRKVWVENRNACCLCARTYKLMTKKNTFQYNPYFFQFFPLCITYVVLSCRSSPQFHSQNKNTCQ